ncbi:hypothetical protein KL864_34345 [Mycolicibacterium goodii]|uniref:hypothetical protein n=1 Tax=Mycolicibacterium goodii TaxID=134601 RepID=UPI001BDC8863|nr:hypothetical protein [Mycolicibacterium goodii]MBU8820943.1 hypothetical protein [Mycolicibacterium goodii]
MNVALAGRSPAATHEEDDIATQQLPEYQWPDLAARRQALNLSIDNVAALLRMDLTRYRSHESGARNLRGPAAGLVEELADMEAFVEDETDNMIDSAPAEGIVKLHAVTDQDTFTALYPKAHTLRDNNPYPVSLQHVAVGRAAAELSRRGRAVEVYRGDRRFDLGAARLATGLGKNETAHLLGLNVKSYYAAERGTRVQGEETLADLLDLDDFITDTAARFETTVKDGLTTIKVTDSMITSFTNAIIVAALRAKSQRAQRRDDVDDLTTEELRKMDQAQDLMDRAQTDFEKTYPKAQFHRSGTAYPVRVLWVAAGRRAGALQVPGMQVRIAAIN